MPSEVHEVFLLDTIENDCKSRGLVTVRPLRTKGGIIDLFAYNPELKRGIVYEALTNPTVVVMREKANQYSKYGQVVFVVPSTFKSQLKSIAREFEIEFIKVQAKIKGDKEIENVSSVLDALGNKFRLKMLLALIPKSRSWSDLHLLVGLSTGSFAYHVNILLERGIITSKNGEYLLTELGETLSELLTSIEQIDYTPQPIKKKHKIREGKPREWTQEEITFLKEEYGKKSMKGIAKKLDRTVFSINAKSGQLGLKKSIRRWSDEENQYLRSHYKQLSMSDLASVLQRTPAGIYVHANNLGLDKTKD